MSDPETQVEGDAAGNSDLEPTAVGEASAEGNDAVAAPPEPAPDDYLPVVTRLPEALAEEQAERDAAALDARIAQLIDEGQEPAEAERIARGLPEVAAEPDDA